MTNETSGSVGKNYSIHENVVISIVRSAIKNIDGLKRLAGSTLVSDLAGLVGGSGNRFDKSIVVDSLPDGSITIEVRIVCEYGTKAINTAAAVQSAVYDQVTEYTGMKIASVKVVISDLEDRDESDADEPSADEPEIVDATIE